MSDIANISYWIESEQSRKFWVFALLPSSAHPDANAQLEALAPNAEHLAAGTTTDETVAMLPWLVALEPKHAFTAWLLENVASNVVYGATDVTFAKLKQFLRTLVVAQFPDGNTSSFRFYDPLIFAKLLNSADHVQWQQCFGPVQRYFISNKLYIAATPIQNPQQYQPKHEPPPPPLIISEAQHQSFINRQWEAFIQQQIHQFAPITKLDSQMLEQRVRAGLQQAQRFNIHSRNNLSRFIAFWVAGLDNTMLTLRPELSKVLKNDELEEWERLDVMEAIL